MNESLVMGLVIGAAGLFSAAGGLFDWEFFMANRKAQFWVNILGRGGARVFYIVLGLGLASFGGLLAAGLIVE